MKEPVKCEICSVELSKYKCPKCLIKYCSVACYKTHSSNPEYCKLRRKDPSDVKTTKTEENPAKNENNFEESEMTDDQVLPSQLQKLQSSSELKELLTNRHLRDMLVQVNSSNQISRDIEQAMQEPIFCEFASQCLEIVKNGESANNAPNLQLPELNEMELPI